MPPLGSIFSPARYSFKNQAYSNLVVPNLSGRKFILPPSTLHRRARTMSTSAVNTEGHVGQSGSQYKIERVFQEETDPPRQVYLATAGDRKFILKYIHTVNFEYLQDINNRLHNRASHVLNVLFEYLADHLLHLSQKDLPLGIIKRILKDGLHGIAEMHDQDIVHTDIKADNFFVNWKASHNGITIERVQLGDLEDAAHIPPGSHMIGKQAGNWMWRSPEAHAKGPVGKPFDIFSYALVCICVLYKHVILAVGEDELDEGIHRLAIVIERQISYFADEEGFNRFLNYLGDNPWVPIFKVTWDGFNRENPRKPLSLWKGIDDEFKSLICAMTDFDPRQRITAR
ncbi:calcium/calmodulin dependent protein kinase [Aspergillus sclerotioniger CBS 115572]|uniref:Calcium/calmodulin dependent protein kinase n=1 Tax=Aspergillus sclerotioniger CBS 115572 TaxID=1450535 RepID=A0A317UZR0_9EURO|nr:calcium/calmodulin dependent protein kinase [Aspergillus sclerotioniger CBS 115572]PWY66378.1 calcium/calmodulin dependent protein kinase [Aspergillus sclerotioniger CBS 115572]